MALLAPQELVVELRGPQVLPVLREQPEWVEEPPDLPVLREQPEWVEEPPDLPVHPALMVQAAPTEQPALKGLQAQPELMELMEPTE